MTHLIKLGLLIATVVPATSANGLAQDSSANRYYLIGNSLTWDTRPARLDGDVQWHVDCGVSLPFIFANPEKPCVKSSALWPTALRDKQYDVVSVQPHYGDESMELVAQMPNLEEFRLGSAQVTDEGLQLLAAAKSLKKLTLSGMKNITPSGIERLRKSRPELAIQVQ